MSLTGSLFLLWSSLFSPRIQVAHATDVCTAISPDPASVKYFYEDNPTYTAPDSDAADWPTADPSREGLDEATLKKGAKYLSGLPQPLSLLVARHGNLVFERYFNGSGPHDSNNIHSASKTLLSGLVGIAIQQGYLKGVEQPIDDILSSNFTLPDDKAQIQLEDLLTMTAGMKWTEDVSEDDLQTNENWTQAILDLPQQHSPGTVFNYSTANTHLLSAILTEATGEGICQLAHRWVFRPIGITAEHWGRDPQGYYSGGYNLYLTARALARIGQVYLQGGKWNDHQIFPADWVRQATQSQTGTEHDELDYGYLWWLANLDGHAVYKMWGYGGQFVYLVPDYELLVVTTADTKQEWTELDGERFLSKYVLPALKSRARQRARVRQ